ncbi:MAG: glycosyltransferase family 39 protein [Candidatus Brocadiia bacterium]|nr:MAG: glycosyltransferase family 39 protein [Candidatus Brocadiia bacterium]
MQAEKIMPKCRNELNLPPTPQSLIILVVITLACLVPFAGKAFHIDEPLFIWAAQHIQDNPTDFYGFTVNWYGTAMSMAEVTKNPPIACYYIALVAAFFDYSEFVLHLAFLVPALAVAIGTYYLARQLCRRPLLAALATVLTPCFMVSSTSVMCDTMMLAFWLWAVIFWMRGIRKSEWLSLLVGSLLIASCSLTKYFGMALLALLLVYSIMQKRKLGIWTLFLLVPVAILFGYQWLTNNLYGIGLLSDAASYAKVVRWSGGTTELFSKGLIILAFTGGCVITGLLYTTLLWSRKFIGAGMLITALFIFVLIVAKKTGNFPIYNANGFKWGFLTQLALMIFGGMCVFGLACSDLWRNKNAESLLLFLWIAGTFIFAGFINWTVNARSVLPMVPAAAILIGRGIDIRNKGVPPKKSWLVYWPLIPAAILSLSVCWADYALARTARNASEVICKKFSNYKNTVWFQGRWGFQYYMETMCGKAVDFERLQLMPEDLVVYPQNNTNITPLPEQAVNLKEVLQFAPCGWLTTMSPSSGAGFYADVWGPLPFVVGPVASEEYYVFVLKRRPLTN